MHTLPHTLGGICFQVQQVLQEDNKSAVQPLHKIVGMYDNNTEKPGQHHKSITEHLGVLYQHCFVVPQLNSGVSEHSIITPNCNRILMYCYHLWNQYTWHEHHACNLVWTIQKWIRDWYINVICKRLSFICQNLTVFPENFNSEKFCLKIYFHSFQNRNYS